MKKIIHLIYIVIFFATALFSSEAFAQRINYPTGISLTGGGTFCQFAPPATLTIPTLPSTQCGSSGATSTITHTTSIFSNTVNSTTGGTQVATLTNALLGTNATFVPPTSTCGTVYYYAVVSWAASGCAPAGSITSTTVAVTVDCTCVAPSTNQVYNTCGMTWYDSGGPGANYGNNQNYTVTFCPSTPGDVIRVNFTSFNTQGTATGCTDCMYVWQANNSAGPASDIFPGNPGAFSIISTSPDGCITFGFQSDASTVAAGWAATISCVTPCTTPVAALTDTSIVNICPSTSLNPGSLTVNVNASPSTSGPGTSISAYVWEWGDGTTTTTATPLASHTYPNAPGVYVIKLRVRDNNFDINPTGCISTNSVTKIVRVLPAPLFTGTSASPITVNCNESVNLSGVIRSQTETESTPTVTVTPTPLPDGNGNSFESSINYTGFFPEGATMTAGCYPTLCFNLEHSWSADLTIDLIAPNGTIVRVFNRHQAGTGGPGGTYSVFGSCVNASDVSPVVPGCGAQYCVVNSGGASWTGGAAVLTTAPSTNGNCAYTGACEAGSARYYIPQTYNSTNSFAGFNGVPLNGVWTIRITDNLGQDNGVLFNWGLTFPLTCYKPLETVTPDISTLTWSHSGSGPAVPAQTTTSTVVTDPGPDPCQFAGTCIGNQLTNNITVGPFTASGAFDYVLTGTDEFGCQYSRTVQVLVTCACPTAVINAATTTLCSGNSTTINFTGSPGATVTYNINGGPNQTIVLNASGAASVSTGVLSSNVTYNLVSAQNTLCTEPLVGSVTIVVNPIPVLTPTPISQTLCSGQTTGITLNSSISGTTFSWTAVSSDPLISGFSNGGGTSINQTLVNATANVGTVTYTITPLANGCPGLPVEVVVTVNPVSNVSALNNLPEICSGATTSIDLSSTIPGTIFNWVAVASSPLLTGFSNGSGSSIAQTLTSTSTTSESVTYTITPSINGCPGSPINVVVTVTPQNTIQSGESETVCINTAITTINLATTGATGATFSGLPAGVTGTWAGNVATISGTPTASGTFNYTVTTTGGCPPAATTTGTITVTPQIPLQQEQPNGLYQYSNYTINLATTGATGATFAGLPAGVTGSWAGNVATISGTPTAAGTFNYTVTTTGGCPPADYNRYYYS
jgi:subtilisin-like proprotein convertase family protein